MEGNLDEDRETRFRTAHRSTEPKQNDAPIGWFFAKSWNSEVRTEFSPTGEEERPGKENPASTKEFLGIVEKW